MVERVNTKAANVIVDAFHCHFSENNSEANGDNVNFFFSSFLN